MHAKNKKNIDTDVNASILLCVVESLQEFISRRPQQTPWPNLTLLFVQPQESIHLESFS